jgi:hypothetical protein
MQGMATVTMKCEDCGVSGVAQLDLGAWDEVLDDCGWCIPERLGAG